MINKLKIILSVKDKQFLVFLLFFSIFISVIETIGVSIIMPFIALATDFELIQSNKYYSLIYNFFEFNSAQNFVIVFGILLVIFYIFRSMVNLVYFYMLSSFSQGRYHLIARRLVKKYMGLDYETYVKKNSSNLTKTIINEAQNLTFILRSGLFMISEIFVVIFIYLIILYINYKITLVLTCILVVNAIFLTKTVSKRIKKEGSVRATMQKKFYEVINKSFGNFKLIKLSGNENIFISEFDQASIGYTNAQVKAQTLTQFPRLFLEAIGFGLIAFLITYLVWMYNNNISEVLSIISMFVLALYRMMPSVNRIMNSYNSILFNHKALDIVYEDLVLKNEKLYENNVSFEHNILLSNISFNYGVGNNVFDNITLNINKNDKIAFIGESGSGKSTLVDLIIGLYKPTDGCVLVDDKKIDDYNLKYWRKKIGYIPQNVYLFDGTVADNVVFGREYDEDKIIEVLIQANIYDFLMTKQGLLTEVGEAGIMLSGGQKQRLAIARALYGNPEILVLDEATSALDNETEMKIMDEIYKVGNDKTLIIIAHRLSTINQCKKVYKLDNGNLINV